MTDLSFGQWLQRRRRGLGLTQKELAQQTGYSAETLRKVEADAMRPSRQAAERLAELLAIAPAERAAFVRFARDEPASEAPAPFSAAPARQRPTLPTPASELFGRDTEPAALRRLLLDEGVRLLSLLGPPGIGKTRLALHTAALLEPDFADGVCFVPLAPLEEAGLLAGELARALGVQEAGGQSLSDKLQAYLQNRQVLLVLDNFEHLLPAAALVAQLLAACPGLKVLVTSRAALHLAGEHEFEVPALALPPLSPLPPLDLLARNPAVALYVRRTQALKPDFRLSDSNAATVAAVCVRLEGLPLAIELAAARSKLFSPAALLARLDQRLALLTGAARDRPARQQTLRGTIDWSYNLLEPGPRALFARLAVFVGGCTLDAAEVVCGEPSTGAPPELAPAGSELETANRLQVDGWLGALIDQSLVRQTDGLDGEPRFWMLETLREYALERLAESGEAEALQRRHADYYLALAENAQVYQRGAQQSRALDRLAANYDNLRAVLTWCLAAADRLALGLRLGNRLGPFWTTRSYIAEGNHWLDALLSRSQHTPSADRVECLIWSSLLLWAQYDYERELEQARAAVAEARQLGRPREIAQALNRLGFPLIVRQEYPPARALYAESLALARASGEARAETIALLGLGAIARNQGLFAEASAFSLQALDLVLAGGDQSSESTIYYQLGMDAWLSSRFDRANECFTRSRQLNQALGDTRQAGVQEWGLGCVALDQGQLATATRQFRKCLSCFRDIGFRVGFCGYLLGMSGIASQSGQASVAATLTSAAYALRASLGHRLDPCMLPRNERQLAQVRIQLDAETFAAAWAAGQALPLEDALRLALTQEVSEAEGT